MKVTITKDKKIIVDGENISVVYGKLNHFCNENFEIVIEDGAITDHAVEFEGFVIVAPDHLTGKTTIPQEDVERILDELTKYDNDTKRTV